MLTCPLKKTFQEDTKSLVNKKGHKKNSVTPWRSLYLSLQRLRLFNLLTESTVFLE